VKINYALSVLYFLFIVEILLPIGLQKSKSGSELIVRHFDFDI